MVPVIGRSRPLPWAMVAATWLGCSAPSQRGDFVVPPQVQADAGPTGADSVAETAAGTYHPTCNLTDAECIRLGFCQGYGGCHASQQLCVCVALTDDDCKDTPDCKEWSYCGAYQGQCWPVARLGCGGDLCAVRGMCTADGPLCVATDSSCQASANCASRGACHPCKPGPVGFEGARLGTCFAYGFPKIPDISCVPESDADCVKSQGCNQHGWCYYRPDHVDCGPK